MWLSKMEAKGLIQESDIEISLGGHHGWKAWGESPVLGQPAHLALYFLVLVNDCCFLFS
jgi:hypothetical protein